MKNLLGFAPLCLLLSPIGAEVRLPQVFTEGAVLQRDRPVPVWGWASPESQVTVEYAGQVKEARTNRRGRWNVELDPMPARREGSILVVSEKNANRIEIADVLVGEVWLASGQSNMEWSIGSSRAEDQEIAVTAALPLLRFLNVPNRLSLYPEREFEGAWQAATPETVRGFSAVAYFFGRELGENLDVPIGIISSEWGGSRIEPWIPESAFREVEELAELHRHRLPRTPGSRPFLEATRRHFADTRTWLEEAETALESQRRVPAPPAAPPRLEVGHNRETGLYQAMIHPLVPCALRGFIWYQGESNLADGFMYRWKMEALITGWRDRFRNPEAPFLFVQLAPYNYGGQAGDNLPKIWAAQQKALEIPRTGMAVINDIGDPADIHPRNKSTVGRRLARLALADTYGRSELVKSGPLFESFEIEGASLIVKLGHSGSGLKTRDGKPADSFELAGEDGVFHPAAADLRGDRAALTSGAVPAPRQARFAWSQTASPNLVNSAELPAGAFHTHWPDDH